MSADGYDVFLSYAHASEAAFADALMPKLVVGLSRPRRHRRLRVDRYTLARGPCTLARPGCPLQPHHPTRRGCQWELTGAYIACQGQGIDPLQRLLVVNVDPDPADQVGHILPQSLRAQSIHGPHDRSLAQLADAIAARVAGLDERRFGEESLRLGPPRMLPAPRTGSAHFVGRLAEMWQIHGALHDCDLETLGGRVHPAIVHAAGMGGMGKSLLAEEYALRYQAAYPGGVLWLALGGTEAGLDGARAGADIALREAAAALGIDTAELPFGDVKALVQSQMVGDGPVLAVLDDLASERPADADR